MKTAAPPLVTDQQQGEAFLHRFIQQPITVTWKNDSTYLVNLMTYVIRLVLYSLSLSLRLQRPSG